MGTLIHAPAHGLVASDTIMLGNLVGGDGLVDNTLYYVLAAGLTADDFAVSETDGGAAVVFTTDITDGVVVRTDTYTVVSDGVMDPPDPVPTPSAVTLADAEVSGILRLRVTLNDTAEQKVRLWEVQVTHKYDTNGDPDYTNPQTLPMPEGSTELSFRCLPLTQYTARVRAVDVYGNASAWSPDATIVTDDGNDSLSASLADVANDVPDGIITETKIADNAISTPKLQAGAVTADILAATILLASLIQTAESGRRMELDEDGFRIYDTDESILVRLPTNGDPNYFKGVVDADSLISESSAEFRGVASLAGSTIMTLTNGVAAPSAAPTAVASVDVLTLTSTPANIGYGIGYDSGAGTVWIAADPSTSDFVAHEYNITTGALVRSISATGSTTTYTATVGSTSHVSDTAQSTSGSSDSQVATPLTMPSDKDNMKVTKVSIYATGYGGSCSTKVAIWNPATNHMMGESAAFTMPSEALGTGNSNHYDVALTSPVAISAGFVVAAGWLRTSSGDGFQWDRDDGGSKTTYRGDGLDGDMTGRSTDTTHKPNVYITYTYDVDTRLETAKNIGVCTDGTYVYTLDSTGVVWKYDRTTLAYVANSSVQTAITGTKTQAGMFYDATAAELIITTTTGTGAGVFPKFVRVNKSTLAVSSTVYSAAAGTTFNGTTDTFRGGARLNDPLNASAATYWIATTSAVYAYTFSGTTATQTSNRDFGQSTTVGDGLTHDGTQFRGYDTASPTKVWKFSSWDFTTTSTKLWLSYAWYDSAGTTHETAMGPRTSLTIRRRERVLVGNAAIPTGGADDPNKVRIYALQNATDTGAGTFWKQIEDALTSRYMTTYTGSGTHDGAGTAFPSGTPAEVKSEATGWDLKGDGSGTLGLNVTGGKPPVVRVYTTTGANTWTKPTGLAFITVEVVGGGGAGGGAAGNATAGHYAFGSPGGGGGYARKLFTAANLASASSCTATVGAGGTAGAAGANAGNTGTASTFAGTGITTVTGNGGAGGGGTTDQTTLPQTIGQTAAGGTATGGDINITGGDGSAGIGLSISRIQPGIPGGSHMSSRNVPPVQTATGGGTGDAGQAYGGGGAGGWNIANATNRQGGAGANGVIIVTEYYLG